MIPLWVPLAVAPVLLLAAFSRRKAAPLPPGPRRKLLIGNLFDVPFKSPWATFETWRRQYGDIVYLEVLGNSIVVLNSLNAVVDLLERRAWNYSHRPSFIMVGELMGVDKMWRQQRKLAAIVLGPLGMKQYLPLQERLATLLLSDLQENPKEFAGLFNLATARLIFEIVYGLSIDNMENSFIKESEETFEMVGQSIQAGAYLIDYLPWLKYIPSWVPFSIQTAAALGRAKMEATVEGPFQIVKEQMKAGTAKPSMVSTLLWNRTDVEGLYFEDVVKWTAGTMYNAGSESTAATLTSFVLAMTLYPDIQTKAQEELDRLLNGVRLPIMEDRSSLPYVNALIKETLRWHVALPLSIPRRADNDDIYNGYLIPKGCIVLPNVRGISGEGDYLTRFSPEKIVNQDSDDVDPADYAFGFGRRACPGKYMAENSLFIFVASILAAFRISKEADSDGESIPKFTPGLISRPEPFKCKIEPRTPETKKLIANQLLSYQ
ncbi:cytochrome P450 [Mycena capillaripes]|nr:cytochrome P450 [Mycena capillaripes]